MGKLLARVGLFFVLSRLFLAGVIWYWTTTPAAFPLDLLIFGQWDGGWYMSIVDTGYARADEPDYTQQQNWAFFPLYPILIEVVMFFTSWWKEYAGLVVANGCSFLALIIAGNYYLQTRSEQWKGKFARRPLALLTPLFFLLCFGLYSFYFASIYTEPLFILLTAWGFYFLRERQYQMAALMGGLMSATRSVGVFFLPIIWLQIVLDHYQMGQPLLVNIWMILQKRWRLFLGALLLVPSGLLLYMRYLATVANDALAWIRIQNAWDRSFGRPFVNLAADFSTYWQEMWWLSLATVFCLILIFWAGLKYRRWGELIFALICLVIPLSTSLWSMPRYLIGCLPMVFLFADALNELPTWARRTSYGVMAGVNVWLILMWMQGMMFVI